MNILERILIALEASDLFCDGFKFNNVLFKVR